MQVSKNVSKWSDFKIQRQLVMKTYIEVKTNIHRVAVTIKMIKLDAFIRIMCEKYIKFLKIRLI